MAVKHCIGLVLLLVIPSWKDQNDEKMNNDKKNSQQPQNASQDVLEPKKEVERQTEKLKEQHKKPQKISEDVIEPKKDVKRQTEKLKEQHKKINDYRRVMDPRAQQLCLPTILNEPYSETKEIFKEPNMKDGSFFKSAYNAHLAACISTVCNHITLISVIAELAICAALYKWKGVQRELENENMQPQKELEEKSDDTEQVITELKRELENQKDQLKKQLEQVEAETEENEKKLQSVKREITEKEKTFEKPEALLKEKENLVREQRKLDDIKNIYKRQLLNIEKLLELLEIQMNKRNETK